MALLSRWEPWSRAGDVIRPGALSPSSKKMLQGAGGDQNAICN